MSPCVSHFHRACQPSPLREVKTIKFTADSLGPLLSADPKVKVIHLLRDPRGMLLSQVNFSRKTDLSLSRAQTFCRRLLHDISLRRKLELTYKDTFLEVKYEDLASDPLKWLDKIYDHLGLEVTKEVRTWVMASMSSNVANVDERVMGTTRSNSTQTAYAWKSKISPEELKRIYSVTECIQLIELLKY